MSDRPEPKPLRKTGEVPDRVRAARERKRAEAEALGIDNAFISELVERLYSSIRTDAMLGPIFESHVTDWPEHLDRLKRFWRSVLHSSGEFTGNPMQKHMTLPGLEGAHFAHWLQLFYRTLAEMDASTGAQHEVGTRARMIADSLLTGIATHRRGIGGLTVSARESSALPRPPYA